MNHGAGSGDGHQTSQGPVASCDDIPHDMACRGIGDAHREEERCDAACSCGKCGGHCTEGGNLGRANDEQSTARVEAKPAEPEDEHPKEGERCRMTRDITGLQAKR